MTYTAAACLGILAAVVLDVLVLRTRLVARRVFWLAYAIVVMAQLAVNGVLTGRQVVRYDPDAILGPRIVHAPVEDLAFGFALVLATLSLWVWWGGRPVVRVRFGRPTRSQVLLLALIVLVAVAGALAAVRLAAPPGMSDGPTDARGAAAATPDSGLPRIAVADLPPQARETLLLIDAGGPYPYRQDDTVFANQEGRLPARPLGYYREYTVATPGSSDRGPRRLVVGVGGDMYYTDDHYASFRQVSR